MKVSEAKSFVEERVLLPALKSGALGNDVKATLRNTLSWLPRFERVGDLIAYMDRFQGAAETAVYKGLKSAQLLTFEDIHDEFMEKFGNWSADRTRLDDFIIGKQYTGSHLVIFAELYDNRSGGILRIGKRGKPQAVFVKATLIGGKYANEWIVESERLKYYLKSRNGQFSEVYIENAAIIQHPDVPVFVFTRQSNMDKFTFSGHFRNVSVNVEQDGAKWFDLVRTEAQRAEVFEEGLLQDELIKRVSQAEVEPREHRLARLKTAAKVARQVTIVGKAYIRNADVVAEVLFRASGKCEGCGEKAPFDRNSNGTPYLEVHHRKRLSEGGEDTVENALALCPNCHRREHFGPRQWI